VGAAAKLKSFVAMAASDAAVAAYGSTAAAEKCRILYNEN
jgi:hypothetical protein